MASVVTPRSSLTITDWLHAHSKMYSCFRNCACVSSRSMHTTWIGLPVSIGCYWLKLGFFLWDFILNWRRRKCFLTFNGKKKRYTHVRNQRLTKHDNESIVNWTKAALPCKNYLLLFIKIHQSNDFICLRCLGSLFPSSSLKFLVLIKYHLLYW